MVRLELLSTETIHKYLSYFNSIKVRLEQAIIDAADSSVRFQFHKGTIRTSTNARTLIHISYFNSIKVRLELLRQEHACVYEVFQFHKGTIRTWEDRLCLEVSEISIP